MATKEQLEQAIVRAGRAGDANAVRVLGAELKRLPAKAAPKKTIWDKISNAPIVNEVMTTLDFIKGLPQGAENLADTIAEPVAKRVLSVFQGEEGAQKSIEFSRRQRAPKSKPHSPIASDLGKFTGGLAAGPGGLGKVWQGTKTGRAAIRAAQGGIGGAATTDAGGPKAENALASAALNVVLPPVLKPLVKPIVAGAAKGVGYLKGLAGSPTAAATVADLGPDAARRAARLAKAGVTNPTAAMVTRNPVAHRFEQDTKGTPLGTGLTDQMIEAEKSLIKTGDDLIERIAGGKKPTAEATGKLQENALNAKRDELQTVVGKLYDKVKAKRGNDVVGRMDTLRAKMTDPDFVHNTNFDAMRKSVTRRMKELGLIPSKTGQLSTGITLNQAESMRRFIGTLGGNDPTSRKMRATLIDALDDDVIDVIGDDAFKTVRTRAKARFEEFEQSLVGKIANMELPAEGLTKHILRSGTAALDDVRALVKSYTTGTARQIARGAKAHQQLKAQSIDDVFTPAVDRDGQRINGNVLVKNFTDNADKLRVILSKKEFAELENLVGATKDAVTAPSRLAGTADQDVSAHFQVIPDKIKQGWAKLLTKSSAMHSLAFTLGGPKLNVALGVAQQAGISRAERNAAKFFIGKIETAKSPAELAKAIAAAKTAAKRNPIIDDFLDKRGTVGTAATAGLRSSGEE